MQKYPTVGDFLQDIFDFVTKIFSAIKQFFEAAFGKDESKPDNSEA